MGRRANQAPRSNGCAGKQRYSTQGYALEVMNRRVAQGAYAPLINTYYCNQCYGWHVGHPPGSGRKR